MLLSLLLAAFTAFALFLLCFSIGLLVRDKYDLKVRFQKFFLLDNLAQPASYEKKEVSVQDLKKDKTAKMLFQAGFRSRAAKKAYVLYRRLCLAGGIVSLLWWQSLGRLNSIVILGVVLPVLLLVYLQTFFIRSRIKARKHHIERTLPQFLDLLVISLEAGLSLNAGLKRISDTLGSHDPLGMEIRQVNQEILAGLPWTNAFRNMSQRVESEEFSQLISAIIQHEKLGTSLAKSLRIQSETLRNRIIQETRERILKTPVKLVFPLAFLIFPTLLIVLLGPALIHFLRNFNPVIQ